jgi:hypothetical protein
MTLNNLVNTDSNGNPPGKSNQRDFKSLWKLDKAHLPWILATQVGVTIGIAAGIGIVTTFVSSDLDTTIFLLLFSFALSVCGLIIGLMQVFVFRFSFLRSVIWILINILVWFLGGLSFFLSSFIVIFISYLVVGDPTGALSAAPVVIPIIIGISAFVISIGTIEENFLISEFDVNPSWKKTSILAWASAWIIGSAIAFLIPGSNFVRGISGGIIGGAIVGVITSKPVVDFLNLTGNPPEKT